MVDRPIVSRRDRPAKPALTREGIVATAIRVMRSEGLERVTMRRLARELDTGPASLYVYVRNTAELHAAMLDELLGAIDLSPVSAAGDWRDRLVEILQSYTRILLEQPGIAMSVLVTRPSGPAYLNLVEAILTLLEIGGVPEERAAWAVDLLLHTATSNAATSNAATSNAAEQAADGHGEDDALGAALLSAPAGRYPRIAGLGVRWGSGSGSDRRRWAFRVLINGVAQTPASPID